MFPPSNMSHWSNEIQIPTRFYSLCSLYSFYSHYSLYSPYSFTILHVLDVNIYFRFYTHWSLIRGSDFGTKWSCQYGLQVGLESYSRVWQHCRAAARYPFCSTDRTQLLHLPSSLRVPTTKSLRHDWQKGNSLPSALLMYPIHVINVFIIWLGNIYQTLAKWYLPSCSHCLVSFYFHNAP